MDTGEFYQSLEDENDEEKVRKKMVMGLYSNDKAKIAERWLNERDRKHKLEIEERKLKILEESQKSSQSSATGKNIDQAGEGGTTSVNVVNQSTSEIPGRHPYKVFVSSTYLDNKERRKLVQDAITKAEMVWHGMEIFTASTKPTVEQCQRYAREADVLVGIIAHRYGWIPDGYDKSITELEYDSARERLMFILDDCLPVNLKTDYDDGPDKWNKQEKLEEFKKNISEDQMPCVFTETTLQAEVLKALLDRRKEQENEQELKQKSEPEHKGEPENIKEHLKPAKIVPDSRPIDKKKLKQVFCETREEMDKITWLHLSDLHLKTPDLHQWDQNIVLKALLKDLDFLAKDKGLIPEIIFITGDLAFSGSQEEYVLVEKFLDELRKVTNMEKENLCIVPGNHDVNWSEIPPGADDILLSIKSRKKINEVISSEISRMFLFKKFDAYGQFANTYFEGAINFSNEKYFTVKTVAYKTKNVAILGLNSAWMCLKDGKEKKLGLGEHQVRRSLDSSFNADLKIALMHHPFDCFHDFDRRNCEALLMKECDFILHGHMHVPKWSSIRTPDAQAWVLEAGAAYESRDYPNTYNIVQLDFSAGKGTVFFRRYSDEGGGFWAKDVMTYENVTDGRYEFDLQLKKVEKSKKEEYEDAEIMLTSPKDENMVLESYLHREIMECKTLPMGRIDPPTSEKTKIQPIELAAVYVNLLTETPCQLPDDEVKQTWRKLKTNLGGDISRMVLSVLDAANQNREMVLLGNPGSGKSTFVRYLALCMASEMLTNDGTWLDRLQPDWKHGALIPLRISLRDLSNSEYCDGSAAGLMKYLAQLLLLKDMSDFLPVLRRKLKEGNVLVMLDGLDEVGGAALQQVVRATVWDFFLTYGGEGRNRFLVTCRGYAYEQPENQLERFPTHRLAPLSPKQIDALITHWYQEVCRLGWKTSSEASMAADRLKSAVRRPDLAPLARNPLQLTMMNCLHFSRGELPEDRAILYHDMVELLAFRWQESKLGKEAGISSIIDQTQFEAAFEEIAFQAHKGQSKGDQAAEISDTLLEKVFKEYAKKQDQMGTLIQYLIQREGLLVKRPSGLVSFPHRSYQEYLAGAYLARQEDYPQATAELVRDNYQQWREVAVWAAAVAARIKNQSWAAVAEASAICDEPVSAEKVNEKTSLQARLAGEILLQVNPLEIKKQDQLVVKRVCDWLEMTISTDRVTAKERCAGGDVLGRLGDPRFDPDFWHLPTKDEPLCGFVEIPAGTFTMGEDEEGSFKQHPVSLPEFYMARYPVTVAQFQTFVEEKGYDRHDPVCLKGIANWPVVHVSWHDAAAYCDWLTEVLREDDRTPAPLGTLLREGAAGGPPWRIILPSEAEWEKAARGDKDARMYPWEGKFDNNKANSWETGIRRPSPVGCFPGGATPYGVEDMSGNVWELTRSLWGKNWKKPDFSYPYKPKDVKREDLRAKDDILRTVRGGSFLNYGSFLRCSIRSGDYPDSRSSHVGFRVAACLFSSER